MKEDFLHYIWKFKKFGVSLETPNLMTANGENLVILNTGQYLQLAGPDFFNAKIVIENQKWAGNVEIHTKSSDWYLHNHERDDNYDSVILHVVWEHDAAIFRKNNTEIPVFELKKYVSNAILENYQSLMHPKSWIFCEKQLVDIDAFILKNWQERLFFERLERKLKPVEDLLEKTNQDWEAVLFCLLAKNFGLNTNGEIFLKIAENISFNIIRKESFEIENLEALLFGFAGLLDDEKEDNYFKDLKFRFFYLLQKYQIDRTHIDSVQFFKHRPDNFPTIRLSQLAQLYFKEKQLFSNVIDLNSVESIYDIFTISVSQYWKNHYLFDKESPTKKKILTKSFVDLLIINTIIPIQFAYAKSQNNEKTNAIFEILDKVAPERNSIIDKFTGFGIKSKSAFETQSLLQLKNEYCNKKRCLECAIGMELLKNN
jgi:hypothetical protein